MAKRLRREQRIDEVLELMIHGDYRIPSITRKINEKFGARCQRKTIAADMQEVKRRNAAWMDQETGINANLRAQRWHTYLVSNVDMLETAVYEALTNDPNRGAHKAARLCPQLLATFQAIWDLEDKFPLLKANVALHDRLKKKEAELDKRFTATGALKPGQAPQGFGAADAHTDGAFRREHPEPAMTVLP